MKLEIVTVDIYPTEAKFVFSAQPESEYFQAEIPGAFSASSVHILNPMDTKGVRIFTAVRDEWIPPSLDGLKKKADELTQAIRKLSAQKAALEQTQILLQNAEPPTKTDAKDIISYIKMAQEMKLNTENDLADIESSLTEKNKELGLLQSELRERMPNNPASVIRITGQIKPGSKLFIEAFTQQASWTPQYVMDLNSKTGRIIMRLYSHAQQKTGLDYTGPVTFHTKHADENVAVPQAVPPLRVSIKSKHEASVRRMAAMRQRPNISYCVMPEKISDDEPEIFAEDFAADDDILSDDIEIAASLSKLEKSMSDPDIEMTLFDHAIEGSGTLTGDGRESEFVLGDTELAGEISLELIPRQRNDAWIMVKIRDTSARFIPGKAILKVDGHQTGNTDIPEYGLGQKSLPFGYVSQITVRKERHRSKKSTSVFTTSEEGYTITVENGDSEDRTITVRDRLPVSADKKKVKLEIKRIDPEPKERDKDNRLTWELGIKSGEAVKINVSYTLSYPLGEELLFD